MFLRIQRKGKKLFVLEAELHDYMETKLQNISSLGSSVIMALVMVTMIVIFNFLKAGDLYYFALILVPLIGRVFVGSMVLKWLKKQFKELVGVA